MSNFETNLVAAKKYTEGRGFGPVIVNDGCRVYKQDDGTFYVFNQIGLGYGDTKSGAHSCWEPECEVVTQAIHEIAALAAPYFEGVGIWKSLKPGDKVQVERTFPIGPDGKGTGTIREIGGPICFECTIDFDATDRPGSVNGIVDVYVKTSEDDDTWFQWGSRRSIWKITKL